MRGLSHFYKWIVGILLILFGIRWGKLSVLDMSVVGYFLEVRT